MTKIDEIAPDVYRLTLYVPELDMQFSHFLVRDEEPLLFHTGLRAMFPALREAVARVMDPAALRHIAWSHFESDEAGALNEWLAEAPRAQPVCTFIGKIVNADDFADRPALGLAPGEVLETGRRRFRFVGSPHIPHGWDAGLLWEETDRVLFCSDLFHHFGDPAPVTDGDLLGPTRHAMRAMQQGPLVGYMPYMRSTADTVNALADLKPETLAVMHGSCYRGKGEEMLRGLGEVLREEFS